MDFLEEQGIDDVRALDGRLLNDIVAWRRYESSNRVDELSAKTMRDEMYRLRDWIRHLEEIEAVTPELSDSVPIPELSVDDDVRDVNLDPERVERIPQFLAKYEYALFVHVVWVLAVRTGRRTSCLLALD